MEALEQIVVRAEVAHLATPLGGDDLQVVYPHAVDAATSTPAHRPLGTDTGPSTSLFTQGVGAGRVTRV